MKSFFPNLSHTKRMCIVLIFIACGLAGFYGVVYFMISGRSDEILSLSQQLQDESTRASLATSKNSFLASTVAERTKLDQYFIPKGGEVAFIEELESLGTSTKVVLTVNDVAVGEVSPKSNQFGELSLRLQTVGSFASTMQFLTLLELLPYKLTVKEVYLGVMSGGKTPTWQGVYLVRVQTLK